MGFVAFCGSLIHPLLHAACRGIKQADSKKLYCRLILAPRCVLDGVSEYYFHRFLDDQ